MKMNPLDIYNKEFQVSALGYNKSQVEEFLDDIGVEYERMLQEIKDLQDKNEKLRDKLKSYENIEEDLKSTLRSIEQIAPKLIKGPKGIRVFLSIFPETIIYIP